MFHTVEMVSQQLQLMKLAMMVILWMEMVAHLNVKLKSTIYVQLILVFPLMIVSHQLANGAVETKYTNLLLEKNVIMEITQLVAQILVRLKQIGNVSMVMVKNHNVSMFHGVEMDSQLHQLIKLVMMPTLLTMMVVLNAKSINYIIVQLILIYLQK